MSQKLETITEATKESINQHYLKEAVAESVQQFLDKIKNTKPTLQKDLAIRYEGNSIWINGNIKMNRTGDTEYPGAYIAVSIKLVNNTDGGVSVGHATLATPELVGVLDTKISDSFALSLPTIIQSHFEEKYGPAASSLKIEHGDIIVDNTQIIKEGAHHVEKQNEKYDEHKKHSKIIETKKDIETVFATQNKAIEGANSIKQKMQKMGLENHDIEKIPGWEALSDGQKLLVLEQSAQDTLTHIHKKAQEQFEEKNKISWKLKDYSLEGIASKTWKNITKPYWIHKEEKKIAREVAEGKRAPEMNAVARLVAVTADRNLDIIEKNGRAFIQFEYSNGSNSPEDEKIIQHFNEQANEFARVPALWARKEAARAQEDTFIKQKYESYKMAKSQYEQARTACIETKVARLVREGMKEVDAQEKVLAQMNRHDFDIEINQITNTTSNAFAQLETIANSNSLKKFFGSDETVWRGIYTGFGAIGRHTFTETISKVTGPLTAAALGGWRAYRKAQKEIDKAFLEGRREESFLERRHSGKAGRYDSKNISKNIVGKLIPGMTGINAKQVALFIDADSQIQRVTHLLEKIQLQEGPTSKKAEAVRQLTARIIYIEQKQKEGLLNYGTTNHSGTSYSLLKLVSEARATIATIDTERYDLTPEEIEILYQQEERRVSLTEFITEYNSAKAELKKINFKIAETARGMIVGAAFGIIGAKIYDWLHGSTPDRVSVISNPTIKHTTEILPSPQKIISPTEPYNIAESLTQKGHGVIQTLHELQNKLTLEYPDTQRAPLSVQHILNTKADKLAIEYGMFKPNQDAESAFTKIGSGFSITEKGDLIYHDGTHELVLQYGTSSAPDAMYTSRMVDTDNSGK